MKKEDVEIRNLLNEIRHLSGSLLTEGENDNEGDKQKQVKEETETDAVPYTMQDELMSSITQTCKTQFGASFLQSKNPMLYYPESEDITLSGTISSLNDAKFQFRYKDSNGGCYIWTEPLLLNDDNVKTLSVIYGVYKNWKQELAGTEDIKPMSVRNEQSTEDNSNSVMVPGDDF